ncbi:hypothetical protein GGD83_004586 [Rhodoblastus sphagnicola]|uniref:hypothetical protein n=1 Tax=Rhodoblastus sphagnicola TaxID=333368 RepID=UPI001304E830|nr:hypothetical protein [Rhodoblastus sphagnicola]MBB4200757.1 hypothetical protein [Rhodoblastus sphagnicola]
MHIVGDPKPPSSSDAPGPTAIYCGNLGSGILFPRATPGPCDEFVDLEITGPCSDDELALIQRLAQADCPRLLVAPAWRRNLGNASKNLEAA